jgi:RNA polymerase sigma factor (sigma-70 family)
MIRTDPGRALAPDVADDTPGAWVAAAIAGDQRGWEHLVERYDTLLWSIARSYRLERTDASDVVQLTWLRLLENLERLREPDRVGSWLAATARNECLAWHRRQARSGWELESPDEIVADIPPVDQILLDAERDTELWQAMQRLSDLCARLLRVLAAVPPPSYQEVSASLDMPIGSIGPRRGRCLDQLRGHLADITTGGSR